LQAPEGSSGTVGGREVIGSRVVLPSHQRYECTPASTLASSGAAIALSSTEGSQRVRCMHGGGAREASRSARVGRGCAGQACGPGRAHSGCGQPSNANYVRTRRSAGRVGRSLPRVGCGVALHVVAVDSEAQRVRHYAASDQHATATAGPAQRQRVAREGYVPPSNTPWSLVARSQHPLVPTLVPLVGSMVSPGG